jgi:small subunit ribosomal protein S6
MIGRRDFPPMSAEKPTYDLMMLLDTGADDGVRSKLVADARQSIESGGELVGDYDWGVRALAYPIEHRTDAEYHLFQFHATPQLLESLDRTLHIADAVLRHRIIKLEPGTPPPPQVRPEARPATASSPAPASPEAPPAQPEAEVAPTPAA